ncbi:hydrogenase accessory protein HypB [Acidithiobacillus ferrivorans SS3]|uniref:Hydrogenase maturation factor HypB n=1 Tax=Acidithiobacillus ferrivorans SS3 TaxID=743299 RepID=G0JKV8_9PROT|nr:hydrogenase nickel incorporation protein HypB [Acidithiobacillus ferrivorans]AEM47955.1 hydrogenase accessory protein HypB [Acidithiobacillus ferrivorans SS3]
MMCTTCGCGGGEVKIDGHDHHDDHHEDNGHHHHGDEPQPAHVHAPGMDGRRMLRIEQDILAKNQRYADANRRYLAERGIFALNLVSSPGSGKTTLLVRTVEALQHRLPVAVIEGDQQTGRDAERIRATGVAALQINTGKGCHLDAHMVGHALEQLPPVTGGVLFIENVGNLVCPAAFDLGEAHKVVVLSVTEGEDKPLKYPDMFHAADLMLLNKVDLLPYLEFDVDACIDYARRINPKLVVLQVSATRGDGMAAWLEWIEGGADQARSARERALRERRTALEQELAALQSRLGEAH